MLILVLYFYHCCFNFNFQEEKEDWILCTVLHWQPTTIIVRTICYFQNSGEPDPYKLKAGFWDFNKWWISGASVHSFSTTVQATSLPFCFVILWCVFLTFCTGEASCGQLFWHHWNSCCWYSERVFTTSSSVFFLTRVIQKTSIPSTEKCDMFILDAGLEFKFWSLLSKEMHLKKKTTKEQNENQSWINWSPLSKAEVWSRGNIESDIRISREVLPKGCTRVGSAWAEEAQSVHIIWRSSQEVA